MELYRRGSLLILDNASSLSEVEFGVWLEQVWFSSVPTPSFLLADSFPVHTEEQTKKLVLKVNKQTNKQKNKQIYRHKKKITFNRYSGDNIK